MTSEQKTTATPRAEAMDPELAEFLWRETNADIGIGLRTAREARGLRQSDVASAMGVHASRVSQIESTRGVSMTLDVLARYVSALGYRLDVDIVDPDSDAIVSTLPVVPLDFMDVAEVEDRARATEATLNVTVSVNVSAPASPEVHPTTTQPWSDRPRDWLAPEKRRDGEYLAAA